jgi:hypothetical protein
MKWSRKNEPSRNTSSNDTYEYTKLKVLAWSWYQSFELCQ